MYAGGPTGLQLNSTTDPVYMGFLVDRRAPDNANNLSYISSIYSLRR
jgi:hypothetical protein